MLVLRTVLVSSFGYMFFGPTMMTWSYSTHLLRDILLNVINFATRHDQSIISAKKATGGEFPIPKNAKIESISITTSQQAIDFMKIKCTDFPESAGEISEIRAEWIEHTSNSADIITLFIHGGAYLAGIYKVDYRFATNGSNKCSDIL
jgi:hypothetical protein